MTPLDGIKVIELARILAGPWAGQTLCDLGADVIKVEAPEGEDTRSWGPPFIDRDGTLIEEPADEQIDSFEKLRLLPDLIVPLKRLADAGYDPRAMGTVMQKLGEADQESSAPEFMSTHPNSENRIEQINQAIAEEFPNGVPEGLIP